MKQDETSQQGHFPVVNVIEPVQRGAVVEIDLRGRLQRFKRRGESKVGFCAHHEIS